MNFKLPRVKLSFERWKWNQEYQVYVSNHGGILDKNKTPKKMAINQNGYVSVRTECGYQPVHRLVLTTWRPISQDLRMTVDHKSTNKRDNSLSNLEWVTEEENRARAMDRLVKEVLDESSKRQMKQLNQDLIDKNYKSLHLFFIRGMISLVSNDGRYTIKRISDFYGHNSKSDNWKLGSAIRAAASGCSYAGTEWFIEMENRKWSAKDKKWIGK